MIKISKRVYIVVLFVLALIVSFGIGFFVGQKCKFFKKHSKKDNISFYSVKKNEGKEMNDDEKKAVRLFIMSYEECLANKLDATDKAQLNNIQNEVLQLAEGNKKIKLNIKNLKSVDGNFEIIKKVRKCQKASYKHMTKEDKRFFRSGLSKTAIQDVITLFHGVR